MKLASLVMQETKANADQILMLRHSKGDTDRLKHCGVTIEEYTRVQPILTKYDYWYPDKPRISVVVVIVDDYVAHVYKILEVEKEANTYSLITRNHLQFELESKPPRRDGPSRRYKIIELPSDAKGMPVIGWAKRTRTPVQRSNGGFFYEIEIKGPTQINFESELNKKFDERVRQAARDDSKMRKDRLNNALRMPSRFVVRAFAFDRNPDVVVEVLLRAKDRMKLPSVSESHVS